MKLFMVLYLSDKIVGVVGPLPGDMDECRRRVDDRTAQSQVDTGDETYVPSEVVGKCEFHNEAPSY